MERAASAFDHIASPFENRTVLFGAGGFGRRTLRGLRECGVEPLAFADNNPKVWGSRIDDVQAYSPVDAAEKFGASATFVVTIWNGRAGDRMADRVRQLRGLGCHRVALAGHVFWKYPKVFLPHYPLDLPDKLLLDGDRVRAALRLWSDESSRQEYAAQIAFRLVLDYDGLGHPDQEHYFPRDLFALRDDETLIDCGAFDGDTISNFVERQSTRFAQIYAYEPDPLNWTRLQDRLRRIPDAVRARIHESQQAVGSHTGTINFDSTGTDLSTAGSGNLSVECIELDRSLQNVTPTLIKFDIEGFRTGNTGRRIKYLLQPPHLAVSAYHRQSHLWEVP